MTNRQMNPKVDQFINKAKKWQEEFTELRRIVLDCQLDEELKWGSLATRIRTKTFF